jgi:hypothetical protein
MTTGAATQVFYRASTSVSSAFLPACNDRLNQRSMIWGGGGGCFPHMRMQGVEAFRLRVGDYRIIYQFDLAHNILHLIAVGHRRDVYENLSGN